MVTFVRGNIFESSAQVITNTVNCVGVMGAGLALEGKNKFPAMYEDYELRCKKRKVNPGVPYLWEDETVQVLNFPTKRHWNDGSLLSDIDDGLKYLAENYQAMGIHSLALPPLGCGLGSLDWRDVRFLVEKYLGPFPDLEVYVYEPALAPEKTGSNDRKDFANKTSIDKTAAQ